MKRAVRLVACVALAGCDRATPLQLVHNCRDRMGGIYRDEHGNRFWAIYARDSMPEPIAGDIPNAEVCQ